MNTTSPASILKKLGITTASTYVPHDTPAGEQPELKWRVSVRRNGREIHCIEYWCGCAFAPSHKQGSGTISQAVKDECETGVCADGRRVPPPSAKEIVACLVFEMNAAEQSFEDWAVDAGYSPDSRSAEGIYRKCCETAAAMKKAFSEDELAELAEAFRDY